MPYTLSKMLDEINLALRNAGEVTWSEAELTHAIHAALVEVSRHHPYRTSMLLFTEAGERELPLWDLERLLGITEVWFPYIEDAYPPPRVHYTLVTDDLLLLEVADAPHEGDGVRVFYLATHQIAGLEGALLGTLSPDLEELVIEGACAHACALCAVDAIGKISVSDWTPEQWREEAARRLKEWRARLE